MSRITYLILACRAAADLYSLGSITTNRLLLNEDKVTHALPEIQFLGPHGTLGSINAQPTEIVWYVAQKPVLSIGDMVTVPSLTVLNNLDLGTALTINGVKQWAMYASDRFQTTENPVGWDVTGSGLVTQCAGISMLGGYGKFSRGEISKKYDLPSAHSYVRIKANFHYIDRWTGQTAFVRVNIGSDNSLVHVWSHSYTSTAAFGVNLCGSEHPEHEFNTTVDVIVPHDKPDILVAFGTNIEINLPFETSWGISNVEIYTI